MLKSWKWIFYFSVCSDLIELKLFMAVSYIGKVLSMAVFEMTMACVWGRQLWCLVWAKALSLKKNQTIIVARSFKFSPKYWLKNKKRVLVTLVYFQSHAYVRKIKLKVVFFQKGLVQLISDFFVTFIYSQHYVHRALLVTVACIHGS